MIGKILFFEIRQRFFHWSTLLYYLMLVFQGIWYTKGNFDYYISEDLFINSPSVFYKNLASGGMLMIIIVAIVTGTALYKDIQHKTGHWLYTLPVNEKHFYLGRFLSAFLFNVLLATGYIVGMVLVPYSGIGEAHQFGPLPLGQLIHGFIFLTVPNLFLLTSLFFFSLVFSKKMAVAYLSILATVIAFLLMQTTSEASGITNFLALGDPFGFVATEEMNLSFTSLERNTAYIPLDGNFRANRLIWFSIAAVLLILSVLKFTFKNFGSTKKSIKKIDSKPQNKIGFVHHKLTQQALSFTSFDYLKKLWSLAVLEFKNVVRPASFKVIIGVILMMAILQNLIWNASFYIGATAPLTSTMTYFRLSFGVFIMILIMVWSGELFFKDKTVKIHSITDTLPVPVWVTQLSRFCAMSAVAFLLAFSFMVIGILIQVVKGGAGLIELDLYIYDTLGYNWGWLTYVLWIALVFFISGITGNRFLTHVLSVGLFFAMIMAFELGLAEQTRFAFAAVPGLEDYSEVSGYGIWKTAARWYFLMWTLLSAAFILLGILFWNRGMSKKWYNKFSIHNNQLSWLGKSITVLAFAGFFFLQSFISNETIGKDNFMLSGKEEKKNADYEKKYSYLKKIQQPKIINLDATFDLFPLQRKAVFSSEILTINRTSATIDSIYLNRKQAVTIHNIKFNGSTIYEELEDTNHDVLAYKIPKGLHAGDTLIISIKAEKQYIGLSHGGGEPQTDLTYNGSFGSIFDFIPSIGYDDDKELVENRKREEQGLPRINSRMPVVNNKVALKQNYFDSNALAVSGTITISTVAGQIPLAPGSLISEKKENGRITRRYTITPSSSFNWYIASAQYSVSSKVVDGTDITILSSPKHQFNIDLYLKAITDGIQYVNNNLGSYPYKEVRLSEINYYSNRLYAYPNSISISEKEGWYADISAIKDKAYVYHSTVSQIIKHWMQEQGTFANVQGAEMLINAIPETLALQVVERNLGKEAHTMILKKKADFYAKEKNKEPNQEPALLYADGIEYLETAKGVIGSHMLKEKLGNIKFIEITKKWLESSKNQPFIFENYYITLLKSISKPTKNEIKFIFEEINK
jgi:ABC-2 type transport system permease protein